MNTIKLFIKDAGLSGLKAWQHLLVLWFCMSLMGLTMNEDAPILAWIIVFASLIISGLLTIKYVKINPKND